MRLLTTSQIIELQHKQYGDQYSTISKALLG